MNGRNSWRYKPASFKAPLKWWEVVRDYGPDRKLLDQNFNFDRTAAFPHWLCFKWKSELPFPLLIGIQWQLWCRPGSKVSHQSLMSRVTSTTQSSNVLGFSSTVFPSLAYVNIMLQSKLMTRGFERPGSKNIVSTLTYDSVYTYVNIICGEAKKKNKNICAFEEFIVCPQSSLFCWQRSLTS